MLQVSRDKTLKIPKQIIIYEKNVNSIQECIAVQKGTAMVESKKFNEKSSKRN